VGKSTIVNSLFLTDLYAERRIPNAAGLFASKIIITLKCTSLYLAHLIFVGSLMDLKVFTHTGKKS
jgi:hypothetical protein